MKIKILDNYIAKQVISTILIVALALLGLDLFFTLVHELKVVGRGQYTLSRALIYLLLSAPTRIYMMFPWAALLGSLIGLGALANHSELVVMRTASISVQRIAGAVIRAAFLLTMVMVIMGEMIAPVTETAAQNLKTSSISNGQTLDTMYGLWVRQGNDFIHVQTVRRNGELVGVTRYQFGNDQKLTEILTAKSAVQEGKNWRLNQIKGTRFEKDKTRVFENEVQVIPNLLEPELLETATIKHPERLSLPALLRTIQNRSKNELNSQNYELAFWSKVFQPLVIILMVFLGVPFVFGPLRSVSMGFRMVVGVLVAYGFFTINSLFAPLAMVYQVPAFIAVLIPIAVFAIIGGWMLKRVR